MHRFWAKDMMDSVLCIGGPGTRSACAIADLLGRGYRVGVFYKQE